MGKVHALTQEKVENIDMYFYECHRWSSLRILTEIIKTIFELDIYRLLLATYQIRHYTR